MTCLQSPTAQPLLVTVVDLKRELESLHYREHKRLAIQGHITAVRYITGPKSTQCLQREEVIETCSWLFLKTEHQFHEAGVLQQVPSVDTGEGERSVSEANKSPAGTEQTPQTSLASESPNRRKRRMKSRFGLTPEVIALMVYPTLCCDKEKVSSSVNVF